METRALAEMAGGVLVAALRSEHSAIASGEITALFARWQISLPDELILQTRRPAGPPAEDRALTGRWQRLCAELLSAHPEAERELSALIERVRQQGLATLRPPRPTPPPAPPTGTGRPGSEQPSYGSPSYGPGQPSYDPGQSPYGPGQPYGPAQPSYRPRDYGSPGAASPPGPVLPPPPPPGAAPPAPGAPRGRGRGGRPRAAPARSKPPASGGRGRQFDKGKERAQPLGRDSGDSVSRAVRSAVRPGVLAFNPPDEMTQGRPERVEVAVARSAELVDSLVSGLRGRGEVRVEKVPTSAFMSAELRGDSFAITALSPVEQIVAPTARWEFDVTARHAGVQTLTLCVSLRFAETGPLAVPGSRIAVPVVERKIRIRVSVGYGARAFVTQNWQWLVGTAVAIGGAVAAFLAVVH